jgi:mannonate dehydratase
MMKRREFGRKIVTGAMGAGLSGSAARGTASALGPSPSRQNSFMHVGGDYHSVAGSGITSRENLQFNLRYRVKHLTASPSQKSPEGAWDRDEIRRMKDDCDHYGVHLEAIRMDPGYITLRKGPERDRMLDAIFANIQRASEAGVKIITYHWTVIPIQRNTRTPGRGGSTYTGFKLEPNWRDLPVGDSGKVSSEDYWERISYFLEKVIPAAQQADVRMACHPYDPPGLPWGYQGVDNWDSPSIFAALGRGRDSGYPLPPARIPTSGIPA